VASMTFVQSLRFKVATEGSLDLRSAAPFFYEIPCRVRIDQARIVVVVRVPSFANRLSIFAILRRRMDNCS